MLKLGIRFKKFGVPPATILLSSLGSPPLFHLRLGCKYVDNDPSAGSPTETLLRLLLPLSDKVYLTSRSIHEALTNPEGSPDHSNR